jgi:hypothetical protein
MPQRIGGREWMGPSFSVKRCILSLVACFVVVVGLGAFLRTHPNPNFQPNPSNFIWVIKGMSQATVHEIMGPPNGSSSYQAGIGLVEVWRTGSVRFEAAFDKNGRVYWKKHFPE